MNKYYCPKCKVYMELERPDELVHIVSWKNGITWFETSHTIFKVVDGIEGRLGSRKEYSINDLDVPRVGGGEK